MGKIYQMFFFYLLFSFISLQALAYEQKICGDDERRNAKCFDSFESYGYTKN